MTAVILTELASVEIFSGYDRKKIWRRVFAGAMYAKYAGGSGVAPYFSNNCPYDLDEVFKDCNDPLDGDGLLSTLATPTVAMWQELIDFSDIKLQFPELVQEFSIFANALQILSASSGGETDSGRTIQVPGLSTVTFLSYIISVGGSTACAEPPNLKLSDAAYNEFKAGRLSCGEFYGGLRACSTDSGESFVVMNGLVFEYQEGKVSVVKDVRSSPPDNIKEERITDIQFGLCAAAARLNYVLQSNDKDNPARKVMQGFLLWLADILSSENQSQELCALQARAIYLAKVTASPCNAGVPIPYLKYDAYKDVVTNVQNVLETASLKLTDFQNQIRARKAEEREIERQDEINQNIINSGKLLEEYISAQADYQKDIAAMYSQIIDDKKKELDQALSQMDEMNAKLSEQRTVVEDSIERYKEAVKEWVNEQMIKACFDICISLFTLGFAFITPSGSIEALESLGRTVQKIQKAVDILDAVIKTYKKFEELPDDPQQVIDALDAAGLDGLDMPTALEWDEMEVQMEATLATGPDISEKNDVSAAFAVLVLRGKNLIQCQDTVQQICADLSGAEQQLELAKMQEERLEDLKVDLSAKPEDLDVANIDLVGLSGQLIFFQRQMLMTLANTIVLQDRALQYEYLRPPTPIGSFTLLNLQQTILKQSMSINDGLNVQPTPSEVKFPIIYEVQGVKAESITNNNWYNFDIALNKREFMSYNYVRVTGVEVEIGGISSTNSGKYYTELYFDGVPFYDRGFDREMLTFQTTSRFYTGLQNVDTSSHEYIPKRAKPTDFDNKISNITPFSTWRVSLPSTAPSNEGIVFDDDSRGVTIRLVFHIYAQLKETKYVNANDARNWQRSRQLLLRRPYMERKKAKKETATMPGGSRKKQRPYMQQVKDVKQKVAMLRGRKRKTSCQGTEKHHLPSARALSASDAMSTAEVLSLMSGKSVCSGWDVVFSMTAEQVNEQLRLQYEDREGQPEFLREIKYTEEGVSPDGYPTFLTLDFTLDCPLLQFNLNNSDYCRVFMYVLSGHYKYTMEIEGNPITITSYDIEASDESYIQGDVALASMEGHIDSQHDVTVNLREGAFSPKISKPE
ncbi:uncharacterized protein [Amphiura filiformis]|uniref:uncharacterized protein n=1 Tax=Amphiura filiformis TaxID=82378 RepID=UPI003B212849